MKKINKLWVVLMVLAIALAFTGCKNPINTNPVTGTDPVSEQIDAINAKWQQYKPVTVPAGNIFIETPSITSPYKAGSLSAQFLNNGLNTLKFARYLAGLSENVVYTDDLNDLAQHGAVLLAASNFEHEPDRPADMDEAFYNRGYQSTSSSNISSGYSTIQAAIRGCLADASASNVTTVGHRRWLLNPTMGKTGFGFANNRVTTQAFDRSNTENTNMDYVLWPNEGYFPLDFFGSNHPWSVSLNSAAYNFTASSPSVKLTCLDNDREWVFSASDKDTSGKYFNIDTTGYGMPYCIIFRPNGISSLELEKRFRVEITGLVDSSGSQKPLVYEVEFFWLED